MPCLAAATSTQARAKAYAVHGWRYLRKRRGTSVDLCEPCNKADEAAEKQTKREAVGKKIPF